MRQFNQGKKLAIFFLPLILFFLCNDKKNTIQYKVERKDYKNIIQTDGVLETKNIINISTPEIWPPPNIKWLIEEGVYMEKGDTVCILDSPNARRKFEEAEKEYVSKKHDLGKAVIELNIQLETLRSKKISLESSLKISQLQALKAQFVSPAEKKLIALKMEKSKIEKDMVAKKIKSLESINKKKLIKKKLELKQVKNEMEKAKKTFEKSVITSPESGFIVYPIALTTGEKIKEGDMVFSRMPILKIPVLDKFQVKSDLEEKKINFIKKDQKCEIRVPTLDKSITGVVSMISPMAKPVRGKRTSFKKYEVLIDIDSLNLKDYLNLSVEVDIIINELKKAIVIPKEFVRKNDSTRYVFFERKGEIVKKNIESEPLNMDFLLVNQGLSGGENLIFRKGN